MTFGPKVPLEPFWIKSAGEVASRLEKTPKSPLSQKSTLSAFWIRERDVWFSTAYGKNSIIRC